MRKGIASLETRPSKNLRSLIVLKEFAAKTLVQLVSNTGHSSVRPNEQFTAAQEKICQKAEQEFLQLRIRQQQKNSKTAADTISRLKQQLSHMFPDQAKIDKAEKIIQSPKNRSLTRTNLSQKRLAASRKKQPNEKKQQQQKTVENNRR